MMPALDAFGLIVEDMAATLAFYRLAGLEIPPPSDDGGHVELDLGGGIRLLIDTVDVVRSFSQWTPPSGGHRMSLAIRCADAGEVDAVHARLTAGGHVSHVEPFDAVWGQRYATVLDPDGNPVDFYAPL